MSADPCPFCSPPPERIVGRTARALAIRDAYPVSAGHTLLVPRRHVGSLFDLTMVEWVELGQLLVELRATLAAERRPDGFNIGVNEGAAAGQTVPHLHLHLIPRYLGDQPDPRGGVRWIFPDKARYWPDARAAATPPTAGPPGPNAPERAARMRRRPRSNPESRPHARLVKPPANSDTIGMIETTYLTNQFLIAMPALADPNFFQTVTYISEHNAGGALGLIINRPLDLS
ncbi:MAG: YqgE/AlgH family protein, partial [Candidatus Competibacter sp.]|nr:YqgE/AlgH family protein [Candidatus Competibacter sp.]